MKKGFTLIELMVVIGIISICSFAIGRGFYNQDSLKRRETEIKIVNTFEDIAQRSFEEGKRYKIILDYIKKDIEIYNTDDETLFEKIKLYENLTYEGTYKKNKREFETTENGNFSGGGYTIYILSKEKDKIYSKITVFTGTQGMKYVFINHYKANDNVTINNYREIESDKWESLN